VDANTVRIAIAGLESDPWSGWLTGALCFLVLRLIARMDALEREQAQTREALDALVVYVRTTAETRGIDPVKK
jgi:hypothetical protein